MISYHVLQVFNSFLRNYPEHVSQGKFVLLITTVYVLPFICPELPCACTVHVALHTAAAVVSSIELMSWGTGGGGLCWFNPSFQIDLITSVRFLRPLWFRWASVMLAGHFRFWNGFLVFGGLQPLWVRSVQNGEWGHCLFDKIVELH